MLKPLRKQTKQSQKITWGRESIYTFIFRYEKGTSIKTQDLCHPRQKGNDTIFNLWQKEVSQFNRRVFLDWFWRGFHFTQIEEWIIDNVFNFGVIRELFIGTYHTPLQSHLFIGKKHRYQAIIWGRQHSRMVIQM